MVSYGKRKLLILQLNGPFSEHKERWVFDPLQVVLIKLVNQIRKLCFYSFIKWESLLGVWKSWAFSKLALSKGLTSTELFNPSVLVLDFDLFHCLFRGLQFFFLTWKHSGIQRPFWKTSTDTTTIWFRPPNFLCAVKCIMYSRSPSKN